MTLAPGQARAYEFVLSELEAGRAVPGGLAVATHMGWTSRGAANAVLGTLARKHRLIVWSGPRAHYRYLVNQG